MLSLEATVVAVAKVVCPRDGEVLIAALSMVLDDEEHVYRFTCPTCHQAVAKPCDDAIHELLRAAGVQTLDELVATGAEALDDDKKMWRELLKS